MANDPTYQAALDQLEGWMDDVHSNLVVLESTPGNEPEEIVSARRQVARYEFEQIKRLREKMALAGDNIVEQLRAATTVLEFPGVTLLPVRCMQAADLPSA